MPRGQSTNATARRPGTHTSCVTHCMPVFALRRAGGSSRRCGRSPRPGRSAARHRGSGRHRPGRTADGRWCRARETPSRSCFSVSISTKRVTGPALTGTAHQRPLADSAVVPIAAPTMPFSRISTAPKSASCSSSSVSRSTRQRRRAGGEIDVAPVRRRDDRPVGEIRPVGRLNQLAAGAVLEENLRLAGAMRDEDQPPHRAVVGRHEEERMMMDAGMAGDLPDARPDSRVARLRPSREKVAPLLIARSPTALGAA